MRRVKAGAMSRALVSLCAAVLAVGSAHAAPQPVVAGPFEIRLVPTRIGAGGFPNTTMNPFRTITISKFRVIYRGKPVTVVDGKGTISDFSDVRILDEASRPALLVSEAGAYLLRDEQGQVKIEVLAPAGDDPVRWQWLDAGGGQPGPEAAPRLRDATGEPLTEHDGRLLLVSRKRVLDVESLRHYPITVNTTEHVQAMGGYNAGNDAARMLSPGRSQFVLVGSRQGAGSADEYALVVAEFTTGRVYGLPIDDRTLRLQSPADVTAAWIVHYFEWTREPGGTERLKPRVGVTPMPRLGRFARSGPMVDYRLVPTRLAMYETFLAFLRTQYHARDAAPAVSSGDGPGSRTLVIEGHVLHVWYRAEDRTTSLYADLGTGALPTAAYALIEQIGARFNEALARGQNQDLFEEPPSGR
jgi:hypothetical protein